MYYPCSENKGADQLRSYCEADLLLCFRIGKKPVSHDAAQQLASKRFLEKSISVVNVMFEEMVWNDMLK